MRRRDFLKYGLGAGAALVGAGAAGRIASAKDVTHHAGHGQGPPLDQFTYKGRRVEFVGTSMGEMMRVDGRDLPHHVFMKLRRGYFSHLFPFQDYPGRRALAMDLIDNDGLLFDL